MELYAVQRENFDGLYVFASEHQRDRYAALFEGAEVGTVTVIDVDRGEAMIREEGGEALSTPESIRALERPAHRYVVQYADPATPWHFENTEESYELPGDALVARDEGLAEEPDGLPHGRHRVMDRETGEIVEWRSTTV